MLPLICSVLLAPALNAQIGYTHWSLEAKIGQSETVAVGRMISIKGVSFPGRQKALDITVEVDEALKGKTVKTLNLTSPDSFMKDVYGQCKERRSKLLFFVTYKDPDSYLDWTAHRLEEQPEPAVKGYLGSLKWTAMFSMDFRLLDSADLILHAARQFVKKHPGLVAPIVVPRQPLVSSPKLHPPGDANGTVLPDVPDVRKMGREMVERPERWLKGPKQTAKIRSQTLEWVRSWGQEIMNAKRADSY